MTANSKQVSKKASRKSSIRNAGAADAVQKKDQRIDSPLLSPFALMALGLTGAATAAVTREQANADPAQDRGTDSAAADIPAPAAVAVDIATTAAEGELAQQIDALVENMLTEKSAIAPAADAAEVEAVADAATEEAAAVVAAEAGADVAPESAEPVQLAAVDDISAAEAVIGDAMSPIILAQAATGAGAAGTASGAGAAAAGTAAAALTATQMILLGLGAVAFGVAASEGDKAETTPATPPAAPTLALGTGVSNGANGAEATQSGGVVTVKGESGGSIAVTFTNGASTVTKTVTGTGAAQAVTLAAGDLTTLGDGSISVKAVVTNSAGLASTAATSSFTMDATAPNAPTVTLSATQAVVTDVAFDVALGTGKAVGDVVQLMVGGVNAGTAATVDAAALAAGKVTISIVKTTLAAGTNSITATETDALGNPSAASAVKTVTYSSGTVSDGYLDGATVWVDMDNNGQVSSGDIQLDATAKGVWDGVRDEVTAGKHLIVVGGTDMSTGLAFKGSLSAPAGSTAINPLTTMMEAIMEKSGGTAAAAQAELSKALGVPTDVDLTTFDMVGATLAKDGTVDADITQAEAIALQAKAVMVANMLASGVAALDGAHAGADDLAQFSEDVAQQLANFLSAATGNVNLSDSATLGTILQAVDDADTTIDIADSTVTAASASLATTNQVIGVISANAAEAAGSSASETDPSILRALTQMLQVQNVFQGEQMNILDDEGVDMTTAFAAYDSVAEMVTEAGQVPVAGLDLSDTVTDLPDPTTTADTTAPTAGSIGEAGITKPFMAGEVITLSVDLSEGVFVTGTPTLDLAIGSTTRVAAYDAGLSSSGLLVFTYTVQAGDNGAVTVTAVNANTVASGAVIEDLYGNDLDLTAFAAVATGLTADTTTPVAPMLELDVDTGASTTDAITSNGTLAVVGAEANAMVEYSANGTSGWSATAPAASAGSNTVYARQTDTAGNVSAASSAFTFTLDTTAPTVTGTTPADGSGTLTLAANLLLSTSEAVAEGTGSISLYKADGTLVETFDVSSTRVMPTHVGGHGIAIDPTAILVKDQGYYVQMSAGALTDLAGNPLAGITDATTWNFTGAGPGVVVTIGTVAGDDTINAQEAAASISVSGTLVADAAIMAAYTSADMTATIQSGSGTPISLTNLFYEAPIGASTTGFWSAVIPAAAVSGTADYTLSVAFAGATGTAAEGVTGDDTNTVHVDTPAKVTITDDGGNAATGAYTYTFTFDQAVTGFTPAGITTSDFALRQSFTTIDSSHYSLVVTPQPLATPRVLTVSADAGAATGAYGNASVGASATPHSVLYGDGTANTLTAGTSADTIFLGAGNDVLKLAAATGSTTTATDTVFDFAAGDKIDLAAILGSGGAGYAASTFADTGAGFVEIKNVALTHPTAATTQVAFDITFDAATYLGNKISGANIDLAYSYSSVTSASVKSITFTDSFGSPANIWPVIVSNMSGASGTGLMAAAAFTTPDEAAMWLNGTNPIIDSSGKTISVKFAIGSSVDTFQVGFDKAEIQTTDSASVDKLSTVATGVAKVAGASAGSTGTLEIVTDTSALGTVGDNQLHFFSEYNAAQNMTHLQLSYDTNSTFGTGATTASEIIALDFEGDVTANLTPASLTYI